MTCKRCGCTETTPCADGCAWSLPDLCSHGLTPEEAAIKRQYASLIENLRAELEQDRFERFLLAVVQGLAANPTFANLEMSTTRSFVEHAFALACATEEASRSFEQDEAAEAAAGSRLVQP